MSILIWILFGAIVGWISSMFMNTDANQGAIGNIIMGIVGSVVAGFLMPFFGMSGVTGFNFYSIIVAVVGAMVVIFIARIIRK
ncbi:MAG: GlsB/YeaQ/YmgE family stress response membrane protein [Candidatus Pacebacteria bacterium CG_4_10_14_3_um_filter_34_15]|nr:GlsB/YeaQ/YmgE family stress response membrane protein [Candidatus Pacearchaeota archaeon]NCQ65356.1 GlsB/YeaQ/YmgE family stress response membrane protein [Candidatus Paceibacterota bacterium]OIO45351.1 MAG: hypothetical protein AUJ41_00315 [Candidatus Pacebacteria bacterium CG1_02_43_31]PIQ80852.1 MAG: GlsB/YeaQ/YmgE family stress response membrane protein [Candidatus Pacebacteria bacterium CG11_big_fil_rev_8_21_14_0_20_34_55]PIX81685.1 MAG: GlsB/YeaQ/YmgE family stress response membrane p